MPGWRDRLAHALRVGFLWGLLALAWWTLRGIGHAQEWPPPASVEALARVCVGEAGFDSTETGDCTAIVLTLRRRAIRRRVSVVRMAELYSTRHFDRDRDDARAWIAGLIYSAERPQAWPENLRWARYRPRWIAVLRHVRAVLRGEVPDPCPAADHWGMRHGIDWERAQRAGWREVSCGETRNAFWDAGGAS